MSHCISVYLIKKEELRDDKLSSILDNKKYQNIKFTELGEGILATTEIPNIKEFGKDKTITYITTDYFGGAGTQTAIVYINNKKIKGNEYKSVDRDLSINTALKTIGVKAKSGMDEFDTIGLGKYRSNRDFK